MPPATPVGRKILVIEDDREMIDLLCLHLTSEGYQVDAAADGEAFEWGNLYPVFAKKAREEGFEEVAGIFEYISTAEKQHERRYRALLKNIGDGKVFKKDGATIWRCLNCGYTHKGAEAPENCPACAHPRAYYEVLAENW